MTTFEQVKELIKTQMRKDASQITPESRLVEDLGADSANVMVLVMELEDKFGITVEDEAILTMRTVADVVKYIDDHR